MSFASLHTHCEDAEFEQFFYRLQPGAVTRIVPLEVAREVFAARRCVVEINSSPSAVCGAEQDLATASSDLELAQSF